MAEENFAEFGEFGGALKAGLGNLERDRTRSRRQLARATSNVRTSGVRFIPQRTLETGAATARGNLVRDFGLRSALERLRDRRIKEQQAFQRSLAFGLADRRADLARTIGRQQFQGQLIGGGIGAVGAIAGGA